MAGSTMLDVAGELSQEVIRQPRPEGREGPACRVAQAVPGRGGSMGNTLREKALALDKPKEAMGVQRDER